MDTVVLTQRNADGQLVIEIIDDELAYDTMEQLIEILGETFEVKVKDKADGIDERIWLVTIDGREFFVEYDDMAGFDIIPKKNDYEELVERIGSFLKGRIKT